MIACNECQTPFSAELAKELPVNLALMILINDSFALFNRKESIEMPLQISDKKNL
jgi:hypothetical protein